MNEISLKLETKTVNCKKRKIKTKIVYGMGVVEHPIPEEIRKEFESLIPQEFENEIEKLYIKELRGKNI